MEQEKKLGEVLYYRRSYATRACYPQNFSCKILHSSGKRGRISVGLRGTFIYINVRLTHRNSQDSSNSKILISFKAILKLVGVLCS